MSDEKKLILLKEKADLVSSSTYQKIRKFQVEKIIDLSTTDIEPLEVKGMLKLIKHTDGWVDEYNKKNKE